MPERIAPEDAQTAPDHDSPGADRAPQLASPLTSPKRHRSRWRRVLTSLTKGSALLAVAGVVVAVSVVPPIGARRTARVTAEQELRTLLAPDEQVVAATFASQRRWTDVWRESFGIVAATSTRILYVGAPPTPLLRPREDGPLELLVESYPYEASFQLAPREVFFGQLRGLALRTPLAQVDFLISADEWNAALAVAKAAITSQRQLTADIENQERFNRAPAPEGEVYVQHIVTRGETLTGLARQLRTTPDVIRQLNQMRDDNIKVGQRLRVPQAPAIDTLAAPANPPLF